jgi:large subunit ribosomal protein L29
MKAKELRERSDQELVELGQQLRRDLFGLRMKNSTNQLDDTSQLKKARRDLARLALVSGLRVAEKRSAEKGAAAKAAGQAASETGSKS